MPGEPESYAPASEADLAELSQVLGWSFGFPAADTEPWFRLGGPDNFRVLRRGGRISACLLLIPMGQFFGEKSVPMVGVAGVATAAEARGTGAAVAIMQLALREMHARKVPLSGLYPATRPLYRRVGYEPAGGRLEVAVPLRTLDARGRNLPLRPMTEGDHHAVTALYRARAARTPGHLDRGNYIWHRIRSPRGETARGFVVGHGETVEGYAIFLEKRLPSLHYDVKLTDFAARTPAAYQRLLTLLADHGTLGESLLFSSWPDDPFLQLLPDRYYEPRTLQHWMLRVVDVPAALEARGYPAGVTASLELEVDDPLLADNAGRFVLDVARGHGEARRGGNGSLRIDVRGLAPLYSGHLSASALATIGLLHGPDAELAKAEAMFASAAPWMPDFF